MSRYARLAILSLVAILVAEMYPLVLPGLGLSANLAQPSSEAKRIMPLGDSITGTTGCWREILWNQLTDEGHDVDFVGHHKGPECDADYDDDNNGFSGEEIAELANRGDLVKWLRKDPTDIMLMHYGSNDIRHGKDTDEILEGMAIAVGQMRQVNPDMTILVAQVIPMTKTPMNKSCPSCPKKAEKLNDDIPKWADKQTTGRSPVKVVDQFDGFDPDKDTYDGLHSDHSGAKKIAKRWHDALEDEW